ncbi:hypothetical protein B0H13DRAFT_2304046 [Mycena leptocephala]|nr:hypothetical protein B0H13DRAFT_2304046 [Mycena leptocephala]
MTPDELASLNGIGHDMVQGFSAVIGETFLLTIYGVFVLKSLLLVRTNMRGRRSGYLLTMAIVTMFVSAIVLWTLDIANFIMEAKITLIANTEDPIDSKLHKASTFIFRLEAAQDSVLGDAIIIHRVWKLQAFSGYLWVLFVPCALLFGSLVASFLLTYCIVEGNFQNPLCMDVQTITYVMPSANTAFATILIGWTTWKYRKSITPMFINDDSAKGNKKTKRTQCERILVLLLESGILYFLFFAIQVVTASPPVQALLWSHPGLAFALKMYAYSSSVIVGMYPTILIVLAHSKHNVLDRAAASSCLTSLPSIRDARGHMDTTIQLGTSRLDGIDAEDLHPFPGNDEEKGGNGTNYTTAVTGPMLEFEAVLPRGLEAIKSAVH